MVARIAWLPALGTWTLRDSTDPFDPTSGRMDYHEGSPSSATSGENRGGGGQPGASCPEMSALLECPSLCNIASVFQEHAQLAGHEKSSEKVWAARGDPTEMYVIDFVLLERGS